MDKGILPVIIRMINQYGDDAFSNVPRAGAMLLDLAPHNLRERMLVRNFIEINGYTALKQAGSDYTIVRRKLIQSLTETYCLERTAAEWVTRLFGTALGYETADLPDIPTAFEEAGAVPVPTDTRALVAFGKAHTVAVAADGTVFAHGDNTYFQCDVSGWRNVVAVAAGDAHTVGLKSDGTLLATGRNTYDQCDIGHCRGVVSVYAFGNDTVYVMADGTAAAVGHSRLSLSHFRQIKSIARYPEGVLGIREDGTVMTATDAGIDPAESEEIHWAQTLTDTEQIISTYVMGSIALKRDGHIYKMNHADNYFAPWQDITAIVDVSDYFAILRRDGTVRLLSYDRDRPRGTAETDKWQNIIAIYGKYKRLIGLDRDGRLWAVCTDADWMRRNGSLDYVSAWYPIGAASP